MKRARVGRIARWLALAALLVMVGFLVVKPHVFWGLVDGFPPPEFVDDKRYATVRGNVAGLRLGRADELAEPNARLLKLLDDSKAKHLLVVHRGQVVLEWSRSGFGLDTRFNSYSMVKSLVGLLVLQAHDSGRISSLQAPIGRYLPNLQSADLRKVPIADFLDMRSGVVFERGGGKSQSVRTPKNMQKELANPLGPMVELHINGFASIATKLRFDARQQGRFVYQNVNTAVLSALLEELYGRSIVELLQEGLWQNYAAGDAYWRQHRGVKRALAYCCLYATSAQWALLARNIMKNGQGSKPVLRADLWQRFMGSNLISQKLRKGVYRQHTRYDILDRKGQALQGRFVYFMGHGGQVTYMMPDRDLVVVRFGERPQLLHSTLYEIWNSINQ